MGNPTNKDEQAAAFEGAGRALRERRPAVVEQWLAGYGRSLLRLPRPLDLRELAGMADIVTEALAGALGEPDCMPGGRPLREAEKRIAFAGGSLGMSGASVFDVTALMISLRDVLLAEASSDGERRALAALFDWFCALAAEGFTKSREDAVRMRHRDTLERGTPVVMIAAELPAAFLLGEPDRAVLEATFGRLLLAVVRVGAKAAILDGGGLARAQDPPVLDALAAFAKHRKIAGSVLLALSNVPADAEGEWTRTITAAGTTLVLCERFEDAVEKGLAAGGRRIRSA